MSQHKEQLLKTGAGLVAGLVLLRLALKPVLIPLLNVKFSLSWLLIPVRLLLRLLLWMSWRVTKLAILTIVCNFAWKLIKLLHNVVTSDDQSKVVPHNCIPPEDWRHQDLVQADTAALMQKHYPELSDLAAAGTLIAIQPRKMLVQVLHELQSKQQQDGAAAEGELLEGSQVLDACLAAQIPELVYVVGTVHVAKQSAEDVRRIIKAIKPQLVVLELCAPRLKALLVDPYADPLNDLEPCPEKLAVANEHKHKSAASVLKAALASRDHNLLFTVMSGLYQLLEDKLEVRAGMEFTAARAALIELQQEQEREKQRRTSSPSTLLSLLKGDLTRSSHVNNSASAKSAEAAVARADETAAAASECSWSSSSSSSAAGDASEASRGDTNKHQLNNAAGADPAVSGAAALPSEGSGQFEVVTVSERQQLLEQARHATWLQRCVAGDRPVMDTLLALWGCLKPLRRLRFMVDIVSSLGSLVDEELIASLGDQDVVEVLMKECSETYPEIMKPLLHDRNWLLATTTWRAAQHTAQPGQPVLAIVGRGHMGGMVYVMHRLVQHVALLSLQAAAEEEAAAAAAEAAAKADAEAAAAAAAAAKAAKMEHLAVEAEGGVARSRRADCIISTSS